MGFKSWTIKVLQIIQVFSYCGENVPSGFKFTRSVSQSAINTIMNLIKVELTYAANDKARTQEVELCLFKKPVLSKHYLLGPNEIWVPLVLIMNQTVQNIYKIDVLSISNDFLFTLL